MSAKNKKTILLLLVAAVLLAVVPFFAKKGAEFGGSDDAGRELTVVVQCDGQLVCAFHHVVVGYDITIAADDDT